MPDRAPTEQPVIKRCEIQQQGRKRLWRLKMENLIFASHELLYSSLPK